MIKIIAGKYKNLSIPIAKKLTFRPSTSKFREAVFSILTSGDLKYKQYLQNATILDLFAGSGSLGFEALSRGARFVCFIDINRTHLAAIRQFAINIGVSANIQLLCFNSLNLPPSLNSYDIVFIDPPYHNNFTTASLNSLLLGNWLNDEALIIIESAKTDNIILPDVNSLELVTQRVYGNNKLLILKYNYHGFSRS